MDHERIAAEMMIARYVRGDLEVDQREAFEAHYVGCHECLEQLEVETRLSQGLKRAVADDLTRVETARRLGMLAWLGRHRAQALGMVAVFAMALLPAAFLRHQLEGTRAALAAARVPQAQTRLIFLGASRGGSAPTHRVHLDDATAWIVLALELDAVTHAHHRVALLRDAEIVWQAAGIAPDARDSLVISIPTAMLMPGDYTLRVDGLDGAQASEVGMYRFRAVSGAP